MKLRIRHGGIWLLAAAAGLCGISAGAASYDRDARGGTDHPLISRYAGSTLVTYGQDQFARVPTLVANPKGGAPMEKMVEGRVSNKLYWGPAGTSPVDVFRNFQEALRSAGFQTVYACEADQCKKQRVQYKLLRWPRNAVWTGDDARNPDVVRMFEAKPGFHYVHAHKPGPNGGVTVQVALRGADTDHKTSHGRVQQFVQIIEGGVIEQGKVAVDAAAIGSALRREGRIALYGVLFDTNQVVIKPESGVALEQMALALRNDPALNVFIIGHTDNQGAVDANLALSRKRAQAVAETLSTRYAIAPARLQAHGVANFAPVALNTDDAGRSKNRRVELVVR